MNNQSSNNTASTRRIARATILTPLRRHSLPTNSAMVAVSWHVGRALLQEDRPNSTQSKDFQKKIARPRRWPSTVVGDTPSPRFLLCPTDMAALHPSNCSKRVLDIAVSMKRRHVDLRGPSVTCFGLRGSGARSRVYNRGCVLVRMPRVAMQALSQ